jgi:hypothetical protein
LTKPGSTGSRRASGPPVWAGLVLLGLGLACSKPSPSGVSLERAVREPSGVTKSPTHPSVFWVHGDSGTGNWLFAVDGEGRTLARVRVSGAQNIDWEDITHDGAGHLWLGDIGNNNSNRRDLRVYRLPEPDPHTEPDTVHVDLALRFEYPEQVEFGNKLADFDAESLMWWDGQLWLLTKHRSDDRTWLYRFPSQALDPGARAGAGSEAGVIALERVAGFDLGPSLTGERKRWAGQVTGAEAKPDGRHWALLSYDAAFVFELPGAGSDQGAQMFAKPVTRIAFDQAKLGQVEAITWDGDALLLINEDRHVFRITDPLTATQYP